MSNLIAAALLAFASVLPSDAPALSADALKCTPRGSGNADMLNWIMVLDDEVFEVETSELGYEIFEDENPVRYLEVVCWKWLEEHYGVQVLRGGMYAVTQNGMARHSEGQIAVLEALVAAQDRHREGHGKYADGVEELAGFGSLTDHGLPSHFVLQVTATGDGWAARVGTQAGGPGWDGLYSACFAFVGAVPEKWKATNSEREAVLEERQPVCPSSQTDTATGSGRPLKLRWPPG